MLRSRFLRMVAGSLALAAVAPLRAQAAATRGEVLRVDRAAGRVTLKHGEIRHLDMPPMASMSYAVANPALLDGLAAGDRVRFSAERIDGRHVVTAIAKAP